MCFGNDSKDMDSLEKMYSAVTTCALVSYHNNIFSLFYQATVYFTANLSEKLLVITWKSFRERILCLVINTFFSISQNALN